MVKQYKHLTDQDIEEGKEIMQMMSMIPEEEKKMVTVYIRALADRSMLVSKTAWEWIVEGRWGEVLIKLRVFLQGACKYYIRTIAGILRTLFPHTTYCTFFVPRIGHKQFIQITKTWFGQILSDEVFELANTSDRKLYLDEMLKMGEITEEEYKKYLSPTK